jgi:UDP-N-acetyl-D-galactosamine dehydrogenase
VLAEFYNLITTVFKAKDIRTAEAAKIIENIQRDLNIALMNELSLIFMRMNIDIMKGIEAAAARWNFNVYYPGAGVGTHCLPVDTYYLLTKA